MTRLIIQIYEVQDPEEVERLVELGVDHIGSVVLGAETWKDALLKDTVQNVQRAGAVSSLIPLYNEPDLIFKTIDYYRPDILHFCDDLIGGMRDLHALDPFVSLQETLRQRFPEVRTMRSIPIPVPGAALAYPTLEVARVLEPVSDLFLTDTLMDNGDGESIVEQPVAGFVGITGLPCDWHVAAELTACSRIPVILAGGISPDNAYEAVMKIQPAGVDSCTQTNAVDRSGAPIRFRKDPDKVRRMIAEVRRAEQDIFRIPKEKV